MSLLSGAIGYADAQAPMQECKPDPETMLQRNRKQLEAIERAEAILFELGELPVDLRFGNDRSEPFLTALGSLAAQKYRANKEIKYGLEQMDK